MRGVRGATTTAKDGGEERGSNIEIAGVERFAGVSRGGATSVVINVRFERCDSGVGGISTGGLGGGGGGGGAGWWGGGRSLWS